MILIMCSRQPNGSLAYGVFTGQLHITDRCT